MTTAPPTLSIPEVHALLDWILSSGGTHKQHQRAIRNYTIAILMLEAGLRVGELVLLRWTHLFFNSLPVTSIIISAEMTKSKHCREIPVSTRLSEALTEYHRTHSDLRNKTHTPAFWPHGQTYRHMTTRQVERIIRHAALESIGRPIHPHVLRHTFASKLMRVTNAAIVQQLLGHAHLSSTQIYCHPNGEDLRNAINSASSEPEPSLD